MTAMVFGRIASVLRKQKSCYKFTIVVAKQACISIALTWYRSQANKKNSMTPAVINHMT